MSSRLLVAPFLLVSFVLFAVPVSASCEDGTIPAHFNLRTVEYQQCPLILGGATSPLVFVYVEVYGVPFSKARLSLPDPPIGTVVGESWNLLFTGDRTTGIEFDFGDCTTAGVVTLGYLVLLVTPDDMGACQSWKIDDGCEIEDCDGVTRTGFAQPYQVTTTGEFCYACCWQCCQSLPPYDLFPADGATDVPLDVQLSWTGTPAVIDPLFQWCYVRISTDPACATGQTIFTDCELDTFSPDFLEPETKYYWQAGWNQVTGSGCSSGAWGESPIRSFTTAGPLPVMQTTWGRVKAMYRD